MYGFTTLCLQHLSIFAAAQLLTSYADFFFFFFGQVIILLSATLSTIQANQQTIWSQVRNKMASSVPSWSLCCNLPDQGMCKSKQAVVRRPPKLVCCSARQPKLHVMNSFLCYSELQRLMEFELCFQLGFKGSGTGVITLSVCLSVCQLPSFLLPMTYGQVSTKFERVDDIANTIKFLHIL